MTCKHHHHGHHHHHHHHHHRDHCCCEQRDGMFIAIPVGVVGVPSMPTRIPMEGVCRMTPRGPVCGIAPAAGMATPYGMSGMSDDMDMMY